MLIVLMLAAFAACGKNTDKYELASGTYEFAEAMFTNLISSTLYLGGTGQKYIFDRKKELFVIVDAETNEAVNEYVFENIKPIIVDKKAWADKFFESDAIEPLSIKKYKACREYIINDIYSIYTMDNEVWLALKRTNKDGLGDFMSIISLKFSDESTEYIKKENGYVMDGIDAPDAVIEAAKSHTKDRFEAEQDSFPDYQYSSWRVEMLEHSYTYETFEGLRIEIYRMNYELRSDAPENIVLAGGMYITENNWVCPTYPDCTYLIFKQEEYDYNSNDYNSDDSLTYLFPMMENDTAPGEETFGQDLAARLKDIGLIE
jgi:hypothetical protein